MSSPSASVLRLSVLSPLLEGYSPGREGGEGEREEEGEEGGREEEGRRGEGEGKKGKEGGK